MVAVPLNFFWGFIAGMVFQLLATLFLIWLGKRSTREVYLREKNAG